jgi:hypothetical protein
MQPTLEILQLLADFATFLGFPILIIVFINEKRKERREREYGTYNALDEKYIEFLKICMNNPELDLYDTPLEIVHELSPEQKIQQLALFDILVSLLERAFLMYKDQSDEVKKIQWAGWNEYMKDYAAHPVFRNLWHMRGIQFDSGFTEYMDGIIGAIRETEE